MSKVCLFFGSFNPIHVAHVNIAKHVVEEGIVDEVWLVISPQSPFKQSENLLPYEHRFNMAKLATQGLSRISVSDVESSMPVPSYTVETLSALRHQHPEHEFALLMGGDNLEGFKGWKGYKEILNFHDILCYSRAGADLTEMENLDGVSILDAPLLQVSSTQIRDKGVGNGNVSDLLDPKVKAYLVEKGLLE